MKFKTLIAGALLASSWTGAAQAAESDPQYLSDWWHQSVNVVGSYHTRFGPQFNNDVYLEYEAFTKKDWFDFYGYLDLTNFFGVGNSNANGIFDHGSPMFMEKEVFPMDGRPATITRSPGCRPEVMRSRSSKPVGTPVTSESPSR